MFCKRLSLLFILFIVINIKYTFASTPDSAYVFAYSTTKNKGQNGLHFAWSVNTKHWFSIGPEHCFLFCDYGRWGKEKRMITPYVFLDNHKMWHCLWSVNEYDGVFAHATSSDFMET
ncbi:MAG: hypothetical protein QM751_04750 [Paludibacteraceae bacterium]